MLEVENSSRNTSYCKKEAGKMRKKFKFYFTIQSTQLTVVANVLRFFL